MTRKTVHRPLLLLVGILLISSTMRAPITGIAPLFGAIQESLGLGTAAIGALTTLPLLAFALASPVSVYLARRLGLEHSLFLALLLIAAGIILRSLGAASSLFIGVAVIGAGIAIVNVLLPGLLKRDFPKHITTLTGIYALVSGIVAALASGVAVPFANLPGSDWRWSLATLLLFPLVAALVWIPQLSRRNIEAVQPSASVSRSSQVWRSALAWEVSIFFGLNSLIYYVIITWLPAILVDAGHSPAAAGSLHGIAQLGIAAPGLFLGPAIARLKDQRLVALGIALAIGGSLLGLWLVPQWAIVWAIMFGLGAGSSFILALSFLSLRSANTIQATALSGMAQTIGYMVAAMAPPLAGMVYEMSHGWGVPLAACMICCLLMAILGYRAGRNEVVG